MWKKNGCKKDKVITRLSELKTQHMKNIANGFVSNSLIIFCVCALSVCKAVGQGSLSKRSLQITGGYSKHGSGDMKGIVAGAEYIHAASSKIFLNYNMRSTINNGTQEIIINDAVAGTTQDASIRFTTAGLQLGVDGGYSFLRSRHLAMSFSLGAFLRYQSASNGSDGYSLYFPAATGLPLVLVGYSNRTPQQTVAFGGLVQFQFDVSLTKNMYVGIVPRFQTDTNGDAIIQFALAVGRRF